MSIAMESYAQAMPCRAVPCNAMPSHATPIRAAACRQFSCRGCSINANVTHHPCVIERDMFLAVRHQDDPVSDESGVKVVLHAFVQTLGCAYASVTARCLCWLDTSVCRSQNVGAVITCAMSSQMSSLCCQLCCYAVHAVPAGMPLLTDSSTSHKRIR